MNSRFQKEKISKTNNSNRTLLPVDGFRSKIRRNARRGKYEETRHRLGVLINGKRFPYRSQTPGEHYRLIVAAMRAKLGQNPEVRRILLATGDLILKPDHHGEVESPPEWKYYEIWMQLRSELQN